MEFLAKHYEKFILGACLLCILLGTFIAVNSVRAGQEKVRREYEDAITGVEGSKVLPELDLTTLLAVPDCVKDKRINLAINQPRVDDKKGSLLYPKRYVICKNPSCGMVSHISEEKCPFCNFVFDPFKETTPEDDTDQDGIPDLVEQKTYFLNYLDPFDAFFDFDNDGFLNIEEYQLKTKMDDPTSFPDLAHLLRVQDVRNIQLPFVFLTVKTLDSTNMADWKVDFDIGGGRKQQARINETIRNGFVVTAISPDRATVTVKGPDGTVYQMTEKQIVREEVATVSMLYFLSRYRSDIRNRRLIVPMALKIGSEFTLKKNQGEVIVEEHYRILSGTAKDNVVMAKLDAPKGNVVVEYTIQPLNPRKDFLAEPEGSAAARMRGGEEPLSPGQRQLRRR
ncbi:MAG: hypothetical protein GX902_10390 [Lentisphaerae bacterium]|nr:hypothetical protein [Lentisphaerota bacterium]